MKDFDERLRELARSEQPQLPAGYLSRLRGTLAALPEIPRVHHVRAVRRLCMAAAAVVAIVVAVPNLFPSAAYAASKVPGLAPLVEVVTFWKYDFSSEQYAAQIDVPGIVAGYGVGPLEDSVQQSAGEINREIEALTQQALSQFQADCAANMEGFEELYITHDVVTNTDDWFTLRLTLFRASGGGNERVVYYHINKATGQRAFLADLFAPDSNYIAVLSENICEQMRRQMEEDESVTYWIDGEVPEGDFYEIAPDQNFYFSDDGSLVIVFNEYDVAPGSMGCVEFTIPDDVVDQLHGEAA